MAFNKQTEHLGSNELEETLLLILLLYLSAHPLDYLFQLLLLLLLLLEVLLRRKPLNNVFLEVFSYTA
jgi:hypothetical protein